MLRRINLSVLALTLSTSAQITTNPIWAELERIHDNLPALHSTIAPSWVSAPNMRGTTSILYSCVLTLFACIYTALHLNVPPRGASAARVLLSKCLWGFAALIAPEIVLFFATSQYLEARNLAKTLLELERYQQAAQQGGGEQQQPAKMESATGIITEGNITETKQLPVQDILPTAGTEPAAVHGDKPVTRIEGVDDPSDKSEFDTKYGFFVAMGGVEILYPSSSSSSGNGDGHVLKTLSPAGVKALAHINLDAVRISRSSIDDRSKADTIQKGLVLLQVTWMAIQCIARKAYGLPICLLELHTMVHVVCAFLMYGFWLKKPLDVRTTHILDHSQFPNLGATLWRSDYFQPRGANLPGFHASWFLSGDLGKIDSTADRMGYRDRLQFAFGFFLPTVYGGVHLSAWNFEFPTPVESVLWKVTCIFTATAAYSLLLVAMVIYGITRLVRIGDADEVVELITFDIVGRAVLYGLIFCRIYIVVEAFVSLRAVPIGVYLTPAWIQMIPHV